MDTDSAYITQRLYGRWISGEVHDSGLLFTANSVAELFDGHFSALLYNGYRTGSTEPILAASERLNYLARLHDWTYQLNTNLEYAMHEVGNVQDGSARRVYVLDMPAGVPLRAGLTVHKTLGSWSSFPAHKFETEMLLAPHMIEFEELFAYVTQPALSWGLQTITAKDYSQVTVISDRDICPIPLSSHPVVAAPGTRLAYFWVYWSQNITATEKFTVHGRV